jgi:arylsulfatase A-like enzyme
MDSPDGLLAARRGPWKYIPAQGGGGFRWQPYEVDYTKPPAQLYNLEEDLREENNFYLEEPEIAEELAAWLAAEVADRDTVEDYIEAVEVAAGDVID